MRLITTSQARQANNSVNDNLIRAQIILIGSSIAASYAYALDFLIDATTISLSGGKILNAHPNKDLTPSIISVTKAKPQSKLLLAVGSNDLMEYQTQFLQNDTSIQKFVAKLKTCNLKQFLLFLPILRLNPFSSFKQTHEAVIMATKNNLKLKHEILKQGLNCRLIDPLASIKYMREDFLLGCYTNGAIHPHNRLYRIIVESQEPILEAFLENREFTLKEIDIQKWVIQWEKQNL